ncbi:hypothetical protein D6L40_00990 [Vibrio alginolyticus]|nr:hypothetical protein [Vibrio alginolyticus]
MHAYSYCKAFGYGEWNDGVNAIIFTALCLFPINTFRFHMLFYVEFVKVTPWYIFALMILERWIEQFFGFYIQRYENFRYFHFVLQVLTVGLQQEVKE